MKFEAPIPEDLSRALEILKNEKSISPESKTASVSPVDSFPGRRNLYVGIT